jgi:DNA-binding NarL/FixJ family response regulator
VSNRCNPDIQGTPDLSQPAQYDVQGITQFCSVIRARPRRLTWSLPVVWTKFSNGISKELPSNSAVTSPTLPAKPAWNADLTRHEKEVLCLLCKGLRVSDIAQQLNLSIKTISTHKIALMNKLTVGNNAYLIKLGLQH